MVVGSLDIETDVLIIGAGPGGYTAAVRAAKQGKEVTVVDANRDLGGVCLHYGCIPTKTLIHSTNFQHVITDLEHCGVEMGDVDVNFEKIVENKNEVIETLARGVEHLFEKQGIEIIKGYARFEDEQTVHLSGQSDVTSITFQSCIICTGSTPIEVPGFPYEHERILSSRDLLDIDHIPESMIIIGGGYIGTEMGTVFGKLGTSVDIVEMTDQLIPALPSHVVDVVANKLSTFGVKTHLECGAKSFTETENGLRVSFEHKNGERKELEAEVILVVAGRRPNTDDMGLENIDITVDEQGFIPVNARMETTTKNIYAIGDVNGQPLLAHKAMAQGKVVGDILAGQDVAYRNMVIPLVVFNDPEIACVGLTKSQAEEEGYNVITGRFQLMMSGRAHALNQAEGFIEVIADEETHRLLGVQSVGPRVSGMIGEAALAIEMGATLEDVSATIHAHPTISEAFMEACDVALGKGIHS